MKVILFLTFAICLLSIAAAFSLEGEYYATFLSKKPLNCKTLKQQHEKKVKKCHTKFPKKGDLFKACLAKADKKNNKKIAECKKLEKPAPAPTPKPIPKPVEKPAPKPEPKPEEPKKEEPKKEEPKKEEPKPIPKPVPKPEPKPEEPKKETPKPVVVPVDPCVAKAKSDFKAAKAKCGDVTSDEGKDCLAKAKKAQAKALFACTPEGQKAAKKASCLAKALKRKNKKLAACPAGPTGNDCRQQVKAKFQINVVRCDKGLELNSSKVVLSLVTLFSLLFAIFLF